MRFVAALDTSIYGTAYLQGQPVDTSSWARKQVLQFLDSGIIAPADFGTYDLSQIHLGDLGDVSAAAPSAGQGLRWDGTQWAPTTPTVAGLGDVDLSTPPSSGQTLAWNATASKWKPANAGGGAAIRDRAWTPGSAETSIDEFNDSTLDPAWTRVDKAGRASAVTWTEAADALSVYNAGGDATSEIHAMMRPLTSAGGPMAVGDAFVTCIDLLAVRGDNAITGLVLADGITAGSGTQLWCMSWENSSSGVLNNAIYDTSGYQSNLGAGTNTNTKPMRVFQRIVKTGANAWRLDLSPDDITWLTGASSSTRTVTPTHVGLSSSSWGSGVRHVASYQFLRRVAGVS